MTFNINQVGSIEVNQVYSGASVSNAMQKAPHGKLAKSRRFFGATSYSGRVDRIEIPLKDQKVALVAAERIDPDKSKNFKLGPIDSRTCFILKVIIKGTETSTYMKVNINSFIERLGLSEEDAEEFRVAVKTKKADRVNAQINKILQEKAPERPPQSPASLEHIEVRRPSLADDPVGQVFQDNVSSGVREIRDVVALPNKLKESSVSQQQDGGPVSQETEKGAQASLPSKESIESEKSPKEQQETQSISKAKVKAKRKRPKKKTFKFEPPSAEKMTHSAVSIHEKDRSVVQKTATPEMHVLPSTTPTTLNTKVEDQIFLESQNLESQNIEDMTFKDPASEGAAPKKGALEDVPSENVEPKDLSVGQKTTPHIDVPRSVSDDGGVQPSALASEHTVTKEIVEPEQSPQEQQAATPDVDVPPPVLDDQRQLPSSLVSEPIVPEKILEDIELEKLQQQTTSRVKPKVKAVKPKGKAHRGPPKILPPTEELRRSASGSIHKKDRPVQETAIPEMHVLPSMTSTTLDDRTKKPISPEVEKIAQADMAFKNAAPEGVPKEGAQGVVSGEVEPKGLPAGQKTQSASETQVTKKPLKEEEFEFRRSTFSQAAKSSRSKNPPLPPFSQSEVLKLYAVERESLQKLRASIAIVKESAIKLAEDSFGIIKTQLKSRTNEWAHALTWGRIWSKSGESRLAQLTSALNTTQDPKEITKITNSIIALVKEATKHLKKKEISEQSDVLKRNEESIGKIEKELINLKAVEEERNPVVRETHLTLLNPPLASKENIVNRLKKGTDGQMMILGEMAGEIKDLFYLTDLIAQDDVTITGTLDQLSKRPFLKKLGEPFNENNELVIPNLKQVQTDVAKLLKKFGEIFVSLQLGTWKTKGGHKFYQGNLEDKDSVVSRQMSRALIYLNALQEFNAIAKE